MRQRKAWAGISQAFARLITQPVRFRGGVAQMPTPDINCMYADAFGRLGNVKIVIDDEEGHREVPLNLYRLPE